MHVLLLLSAAHAYESEPQEVIVSDTAELFQSAEFDTDWLPADSPIAVRFQIVADGGAWVWMEGISNVTWPEALTLDFVGDPGTGELVVDSQIDAVTSVKFDIDIYSYEAEVDRREIENITGATTFDPWLLPGSLEDYAETTFSGTPTELLSYTLGVFSGVDLVFTADMVPTSSTIMEGVSWGVYDGFIEEYGQTVLVDPSGAPVEELEATYVATFDSTYDLVFTPYVEVCIDILGCYELASFDIELPISSDYFEHEFPFNELAFPLPLLSTEVDVYDFGEIELGQIANLEVPISNVGEMDLEGEALVMGDPDFTAYPEYFLAGPGYADGVVVTFAPTAAGAFEASLLLRSNDPFTPEKEVLLTGLAVDPGEAGTGEGEEGATTTTVSTELKGCGCSAAAPERTGGTGLLAALLLGLGLTRRRKDL